MTLRLERCDDAEEAERHGAEAIAATIATALEEKGACALAVSGGRSPWRMFELLGEREIEWGAVEVFQVDERIAPDGDPDRNLTHLRASLPGDAAGSIRPMPVTDPDPEAAAGRYAGRLPGALDLVHLGLGPDGHTASLVPGDPVLEVDDRLVALSREYQGRRRMTLTYPALAAARRILWLVTGADKREPLARLLAGDPAIPAGRVSASEALVIASRDALGSDLEP